MKRPQLEEDLDARKKRRISRPSIDDLSIRRPKLTLYLPNADGIMVEQEPLGKWPPKVSIERNPYAVRACKYCGRLYGKPCDGKDRTCGNRWYMYARVEKGMEKVEAVEWANKKAEREREKERCLGRKGS